MPKNHHYVPRFYLRQFSLEPGTPTHIWRYRFEQTPQFSAIKSTGSENHLYSFHQADGTLDSSTVEDRLGRLEDKAVKALRKLVFQEQPISNEVRLLLSNFLSSSIRRTPKHRRKHKPTAQACVEKMREETYQRELAGKYIRTNYPHFTEEERLAGIEIVLPRIRDYLDSQPDVPDYLYPNTILDERSVAPDAISAMHWRFFKAPGEQKFITSDNPVAYSSGVGLSHKTSIILWPISKDYLLQATARQPQLLLYQPLSNEQVQHLNRETIRNADKELYAGNCCLDLAEALNKEIRRRLSA